MLNVAAFSKPMGKFQTFSLTTSQTQRAPVTKEIASNIVVNSSQRAVAATRIVAPVNTARNF
jgi:hypothetical protein